MTRNLMLLAASLALATAAFAADATAMPPAAGPPTAQPSASPTPAPQPPAPPPPAPGSPGLFVSAKSLADGIEEAKKKNPDLAISSVGVTTQYSIHQVFRGKSAPPAIHKGFTELHYVLDGGATFVTGGTIKGTGPTAVVEGGVTQKVAKGDAVIVPPDTPHWYQAVDGTITYLEVRFVAPAAP